MNPFRLLVELAESSRRIVADDASLSGMIQKTAQVGEDQSNSALGEILTHQNCNKFLNILSGDLIQSFKFQLWKYVMAERTW